MWAWFDLFKFGYATVIFFTPKSLLTWRVLYIFELDVVKLLNYILLERLFFLPEPGQIHVFDKNQTSDIIKHLPTPFFSVLMLIRPSLYALPGWHWHGALLEAERAAHARPTGAAHQASPAHGGMVHHLQRFLALVHRQVPHIPEIVNSVSDTTNQSVTVLKSVPLPVPVPHRSHSETFTRQISTGPYLYSNFNKT